MLLESVDGTPFLLPHINVVLEEIKGVSNITVGDHFPFPRSLVCNVPSGTSVSSSLVCIAHRPFSFRQSRMKPRTSPE
jgi:hypothetical protein